MDESGRSTEQIRQDIAREEENLSRTAQQIGDRLQEKLDWSEYVKNAPYWALGISVGIGFYASRIFQTRTTPMERIIGYLAEEVRDSARPSLAQLTLLGIATKLAAEWIKNANSTSGSSGVTPPSQAESDSTINSNSTI